MYENPEAGLAEVMITGLCRTAWAFRVEIALLGILNLAFSALASQVGRPTAGGLLGGLMLLCLVVPQSRRRLWHLLRRARLRRRFERALRAIALPVFELRLPWVIHASCTGVGDRLKVRLPAGAAVADLEAVAERLASCLRIREVRVTRDRGDASVAELRFLRRDPFAAMNAPVWPCADSDRLSLWEPIPVGVDEDGEVIAMSLPERNLLLGGEPGAGKSVALSVLVAAAALDPSVRLWLLDGKLVELAPWLCCAAGNAGPDLAAAVTLIDRVRVEMDARYSELLALGRRKVTAVDHLPLHVVVCDELAFYLTAPDRKARADFADGLRDLVARGRAAGVIVLAATQKPASDIVPTSLRDLFGFRWALRCASREASDTILGSGWASLGWSASDVDPATRGVGLLLHEGGQPRRLRSFHLDDETVSALAMRAKALRTQEEVFVDGHPA